MHGVESFRLGRWNVAISSYDATIDIQFKHVKLTSHEAYVMEDLVSLTNLF